MTFKELVKKTRSYRRFKENEAIEMDLLREFIETTRYCPSGANRQPLKYKLFNQVGSCEAIFPSIKWAGYLADWEGPQPGQRPSAYIAILTDSSIHSPAPIDIGIAAQTIVLAAREKGIGACMIGSFNKGELVKQMSVSSPYDLSLIIALGYPDEKIIIEDIKTDIKYYRDAEGTHFVPKRKLEDIIIG